MVLSGLMLQRALLRAAFAFISFSFVIGASAQPTELAGTMPEDYLPELKEILATALQRSPQLIAADFDRSVQEARIYIANSARLPSVRGTSEYASNQTSASGNSSSQSRASGFFYRFEAGQALFHWGALKNQSLAAQINLLVAKKNFAIVTRELSGVLRKSYLALIVEKGRLRQNRRVLELMGAEIQVLEEKKQSGSISAAALEGEKFHEREVRLDLERAEADFTANRRRLARLAGMADVPEAKVADDIPRPIYSEALTTSITSSLLREGAKSTLEYEVYDLKVREATLRHKIEKTRLLPKINMGAGYSLENNTDVNGNSVTQQAFQRQSINVNAQWNMFDGLATRGAIREALAAKRLHERNLNVKVEQILQDAQILERTLKLDVVQLDLSEIRRGMAVEGQKRATEEVAQGLIARTDIERANVAILQADAKNLEARAVFFGRWSDFVALTGDDPVLTSLPSRYVREK
jgi:outer membrane protein TolC